MRRKIQALYTEALQANDLHTAELCRLALRGDSRAFKAASRLVQEACEC